MSTSHETSSAGEPNLQREFFKRLGPGQQFQQLFEHLPGVYFFCKDADSRMMAASRPIYERLGFSSEAEIVGTTDYHHFPSHIAEGFVNDDRRVMETGEPIINRVEIWYNEQKLQDWFVTTKLPLRDVEGHIIGVMGTVRSYEGNRRDLKIYSQIDVAVNYIRENFHEAITVQDLADLVGISRRQLHRHFMDAFNMSAQVFLIKTRIQAACDALITTDWTIGEIAQAFGFYDQSAFGKQFHKHTGLSPSRFRATHT